MLNEKVELPDRSCVLLVTCWLSRPILGTVVYIFCQLTDLGQIMLEE